MLIFKQAESRVRPKEKEEASGGRYFIRKNIKSESRTDQEGAAFVVWVYDEAVANAAEYAAYVAVQDAEMLREAEIVDEYTLKLIEEGVL